MNYHANAGVAERMAAEPTRERRTQMERVYETVATCCIVDDAPPTAAEIAAILRLDHVQVQRRLSDLANAGRVVKRDDLRRRCRVKGSVMSLWTLPEGQGKLL